MEISPKYRMELTHKVNEAIYEEYKTYKYVKLYIEKWHQEEGSWNNAWENFIIYFKDGTENIDLLTTLHKMEGEDLLKIAIDMGIETPNFIPSIPTFKNELKSSYKTASATFEKAFQQIESHPDIAVGLANSALESIICEILKDERVTYKTTRKETLYKLTQEILKEFSLFPNGDMPKEIKAIGSALLKLNQNIEQLRSDKTIFHGKTEGDIVIEDSIYTYFIVNSVTTVGLFLNSFYKYKLPKPPEPNEKIENHDDLPF
ncbi:abortive infection family protein [Galbibacter sp.]|uniref:abortive infection family protein n=1 Tax=Galbibacter sp. TaxID=2918471 RepID=UPI003A8E31C5